MGGSTSNIGNGPETFSPQQVVWKRPDERALPLLSRRRTTGRVTTELSRDRISSPALGTKPRETALSRGVVPSTASESAGLASSLEAVPLFPPGIGVVVVPEPFPEAGLVGGDEL